MVICKSSKAAFHSAVIMNVDVSSSIGTLLCVRESSSLVFDSARFHGNTGLPIVGDASAVHIQISRSRFTNNTNLVDGVEGAALLLNGGTGLVQSSTFAGNRAVRGGAIGPRNQPRLTVTSSSFRDNEGRPGGLDQSLQIGSLLGVGCFLICT
jgi:hypothetical protein